MADAHPLRKAIDAIGLMQVARACGVTHQAVRKWEARGRMPRTEWTGETRYAEAIDVATRGMVCRADLLGPWPHIQVLADVTAEVAH